MTADIILRQGLLFAHIVFFALALGAILREDIRLLFAKRIDAGELSSTAHAIKWLLIALWITGLPMVFQDVGLDPALLLSKPKIMTKLTVVIALTLNGVLLHAIVFPLLTRPQRNAHRAATVAAIFGSLSTASWLYASFIGVARLIAPYLTFTDFLALYLLALTGAVATAILFVRDGLARKLDASPEEKPAEWKAAYREVETAIGMLTDAHRKLRAVELPPPAQAVRSAA